MPDLRDVVLREMKRREWTAYRLVQELKGKRKNGQDVPHMTVYQFVKKGTALNSRDLGLIFDVLEIDAVPRHAKRKAATK